MNVADVGDYFKPHQVRAAQAKMGNRLIVDSMDHMVMMIDYRISETRKRGPHGREGLVAGLAFLSNLRTQVEELRRR